MRAYRVDKGLWGSGLRVNGDRGKGLELRVEGLPLCAW